MRMNDTPRKARGVWLPILLLLLGLGALAFAFWAGRQGWGLARAIEEAETEFKTDRFTMAYAKWGTYWAAMANGFLLLGLAATWRWWRGEIADREETKLPPVGKWGWIVLAASLLVGGWLRWERAGLSLYNDEAHSFKRYVAGDFRVSDHKWRQVTWLKTFFYNKVANNSFPSSALERLSYEAWLKTSHSKPGTVNERALRFPVILASMLGCVLLWATARRLWGNSAAVAVAMLSAVHFWMVRYGNEARGYSLAMLGVALMAYALTRVWHTHRWRWWLLFALGQWLCLYSFSGSLYFVFILNIGLLGNLALRVWRRAEPKEVLYRPLVAISLAAILTIQLMLPALPQLAAAITGLDSLKGPMGWLWVKDIVAYLGSGLSCNNVGGGHDYPSVLMQFPGRWALIPCALLLLGSGLVRVWRGGALVRIICLPGLASIPLSWAIMSAKGVFLLPWYVLSALPGLLMVMAANFAPSTGKFRVISRVAAVVLVGSWLWVNAHVSGIPKENVRATFEFVRSGPDGAKRLFGSFKSDVDAYDSHHVPWDNAQEFEALLERARAEQAELWIAYTREPLLITQLPAIHARLHDPAEFQLMKTFPPMDEAQFTHYVLKWIGK